MEEEKILTPEQLQIIKLVADEPKLSKFYLSGGTALSAFHIQHRLSEDLDFFCPYPVDHFFLYEFIDRTKKYVGAETARNARLFDRHIFFLEWGSKKSLKMEFTKYPFEHLGKTATHYGIQVDSLRDLAANKFMALIDRFDPKDFVDLYFLLQQFSLTKIRRDAERKFNVKIGPMVLGSELSKVRRIEALPAMLQPLTVAELKSFFTRQARAIGKSVVS